MSESESVPERNVAMLRETLHDHGLFEWLDVSIEELSAGRAVLRVPFDEKFANLASGTMHGGVTATVVDTASGFALRSTLADPSDANLTTTDLNVRYVRPVRSDLTVEAEVVRSGTTMGVTECEATVEHEGETKVAATGGTTYRLFRGEA
ncbi:PaaI family thioesterase [Salinirubellus salinus]|uniref:PaaI family thioesterase n=1 Tax=Salinirubellus salinus TaxID=1364945 RepID=A0A9E7R5Z3_9EURY|nr:PaaI family thioesterase [Salinirubellus salinus]UWM55328.1 PaaI family thioesterase [Salinirubellus salinus]